MRVIGADSGSGRFDGTCLSHMGGKDTFFLFLAVLRA